MKLFKKYYLNIKDINISHIVFSLLFLITLIGCALLNKVFSSPNLYGSEIFHSDTAFKNQILLIAIFFIFYLIFFYFRNKNSITFNSKKTIYYIFFFIILYKIYLYRLPFDFGNIQIEINKYFVDKQFNYYKSVNYLMFYLNYFFESSQIINSSLQVLFGIFSLIFIFLFVQKYDENNLFAILAVLLLIFYMPWNMVETLIGPDPLFGLILYSTVYLILSTKKSMDYKFIVLLNLLFFLGGFTKDTFAYLAPLLILYTLLTHSKFKILTSTTLILNLIFTSFLISNINLNKYGVKSFYKNQVYLLKIMTYGYLNPNIKELYIESLTKDAKILLKDIDYNYRNSVTPHKREPFIHSNNNKLWSYIRPDYENIKLKGSITKYKANLNEIINLINSELNLKINDKVTHISDKDIIHLFKNVKKHLKSFSDKEMLDYIKSIVYDGYFLTSRMCNDTSLNQYSMNCVSNVFSTIDHQFMWQRSDDNFYKTPVINMATKYDPISKSYSHHEKIDSVTEIIMQKPLLFISQSILSFFGNTGYVPTPTSMGDANKIFKKNNIPKWFYKEAQRIYFPIINYWYVYCIFSLFYSIFFINNMDMKYKNILFSIIPLYFGALISFFSFGEVPRQMLLIMPFIFYNFLNVISFIFYKARYIIFNNQNV